MTAMMLGAGLAAIVLGVNGFHPDDVPLTKSHRIKGEAVKVVAALCLVIGAALIIAGLVLGSSLG